MKFCDFNNNEEKNTYGTNIPGSLVKIKKNPILIIFYYNNTSEKILTDFYLSSLDKDLERGSSEDSFFNSIRAGDNDFLFGFVNLDLEKEVREIFRNIDDGNPFSWTKIEKNEVSGVYSREPFIIFYYQTMPQIMYEGVVSSDAIKKEFKTWRTKLKEIENKEIQKTRTKVVFQEGYYMCLNDNIPYVRMRKGKYYYVTENLDKGGDSKFTFLEV